MAWGELDVDVSLRRSTVTLLEGPKDNTATGEETGGVGVSMPNRMPIAVAFRFAIPILVLIKVVVTSAK